MKKTPTKNKILGTILGVVIFLFITTSLFNRFFPYMSDAQIEHKPKYKLTAKAYDKKIIANKEAYRNNLISKELYFKIDDSLFLERKSVLKSTSKKRVLLAKEHSFLGRNSFKFWIWVIGLINIAFYFSLKGLYDTFKNGYSKKRHFILSVVGIFICFFNYVHMVFLTQRDFLLDKYVGMLILSGVLCTIFTYYLVKYYTYKDDIILRQLSFIERVKTIHYPKVALKARYAEKYDEAMLSNEFVSDSIDDFQNDLRKTVKDI